MTDVPPAHLIDWQGKRLDAAAGTRDRRQGGASERPLHRRRDQQPGARPGLGLAGRRADRRLHLRRPALDDDPARQPKRATGPRASTWPRRWARRRPPPPPARRASCAATRSPCCRSPATTWATTSSTGSISAHAGRLGRRAAEDLLRQLVQERRRTASSSGRATARTCASSNGSSSASKAAPKAS